MTAITTNPTRRAILAGAAVAATVPALALAADNSRDGVSLDFRRRVANYRAARRAADRFDEGRYAAVRADFFAVRDALPHQTFTYGEGKALSTDNAAQIAVAKGMQRVPPIHLKADARQAHRQLLEAHEAREAEIARLRDVTGLTEASLHYEDLCEAAWNALSAVEAYQPKNLIELHAKLAFLIETGAAEADDTLPRLMDEMGRLLAAA